MMSAISMSEEQEGSPAGIKGSVGVRGVRLRAKRAIAGGHNALTMASARAVFLTEDAVDPESWVKVTQDSGGRTVARIQVSMPKRGAHGGALRRTHQDSGCGNLRVKTSD